MRPKIFKKNYKKEEVNFKDLSLRSKMSYIFMGLGQILYKQYAKGLIFIGLNLMFIFYFLIRGINDLIGLFTLGTQKADLWLGIEGDNSVVFLLMGIFSIIIIITWISIYTLNIRDIKNIESRLDKNENLLGFNEEFNKLFDKKFYIFTLALPILGVLVFNVLPIVFMILIAFTNYGGNIIPPELVDWVGLENFKNLLTLSKFAPTFFKILTWNLLWAVASTTLNYFLGLGLALLYENKFVKHKAFWKAFPILAYAIPGFITLLAFKFMFSYGGPINQLIVEGGNKPIGFLDLDAKWMARLIGLGVNAWISIPSIMLLASGLLSNRNMSLYEAASIDGASSWTQFKRITLPYMIYATTPVLIGQFVGNFNNFGIFYFLRGGLYLDGYFLASDTDLLINWLYNLSISNNYYNIGAAISLVIFIITSALSLLVYVRTNSYKED